MMHAVLADRAKQRRGEPAKSPAAHHEQVSAVGGLHQHLGDPRRHTISDLLSTIPLSVLCAATVAVTGLAMGWRPEGGIAGAVAG